MWTSLLFSSLFFNVLADFYGIFADPALINVTFDRPLATEEGSTPLDKINDTGRLFIIFSPFFPLLLFFPLKTVLALIFEGARRLFYASFISSTRVHFCNYIESRF